MRLSSRRADPETMAPRLIFFSETVIVPGLPIFGVVGEPRRGSLVPYGRNSNPKEQRRSRDGITPATGRCSAARQSGVMGRRIVQRKHEGRRWISWCSLREPPPSLPTRVALRAPECRLWEGEGQIGAKQRWCHTRYVLLPLTRGRLGGGSWCSTIHLAAAEPSRDGFQPEPVLVREATGGRDDTVVERLWCNVEGAARLYRPAYSEHRHLPIINCRTEIAQQKARRSGLIIQECRSAQ